jgi:hypothetical protein
MATTFTSAAAAADNAFKTLGVFARTFTYPVAAALVVNDVIQALPVFAGETVLGVEINADDLDDGTAIVLAVGDGTTADRYITGSTVAQAGGLAKHTQGAPYQYTADDTIDVKVTTAPTTGTTGNITVTALLQAA